MYVANKLNDYTIQLCKNLSLSLTSPWFSAIKPAYLPANTKNEKEWLWKFGFGGKLTPDQFAWMVPITKDYVWKENSRS